MVCVMLTCLLSYALITSTDRVSALVTRIPCHSRPSLTSASGPLVVEKVENPYRQTVETITGGITSQLKHNARITKDALSRKVEELEKQLQEHNRNFGKVLKELQLERADMESRANEIQQNIDNERQRHSHAMAEIKSSGDKAEESLQKMENTLGAEENTELRHVKAALQTLKYEDQALADARSRHQKILDLAKHQQEKIDAMIQKQKEDERVEEEAMEANTEAAGIQ